MLFGKKLPKVNGFVPVLIPFFEFDILAELIVNLGALGFYRGARGDRRDFLDADYAGYAVFLLATEDTENTENFS